MHKRVAQVLGTTTSPVGILPYSPARSFEIVVVRGGRTCLVTAAKKRSEPHVVSGATLGMMFASM
jgi:hypothetical protein